MLKQHEKAVAFLGQDSLVDAAIFSGNRYLAVLGVDFMGWPDDRSDDLFGSAFFGDRGQLRPDRSSGFPDAMT